MTPSASSDDRRAASKAPIAVPSYILNLAHTQAMEFAPSSIPDLPCGGTKALDPLHDLGLSRFAKRASHLATRLDTASGTGAYDQVACEEIAVALGYGGNEGPMRRCAQLGHPGTSPAGTHGIP
ncbi:MAG: hypothetical protein EXR45_08305 [Chloroflexi bacterium]|nr:hypothetical protein [Chloroflexota bacterium]